MNSTIITASKIEKMTLNRSIVLIVILGMSGCGKTYLAEALIKSMPTMRGPCCPLFIDEAGDPSIKGVIVEAVRTASQGRPVIITAQQFGDVAEYVETLVKDGSAVVLSGMACSISDAERLTALFDNGSAKIATDHVGEFVVLHRTDPLPFLIKN
jgi:GTPase SAR1 family protein